MLSSGRKSSVRGSCCDSEKRPGTASRPGIRFPSQAGDFGSGMQRTRFGVRTLELGLRGPPAGSAGSWTESAWFPPLQELHKTKIHCYPSPGRQISPSVPPFPLHLP